MQQSKQKKGIRNRESLIVSPQGELHPHVSTNDRAFSIMSFNQQRYIRNKEWFKKYYKKNRKNILTKVKEKQKIYKRRDHGLYRTYQSMIDRCNSVNHVFYHRYGGRGIKSLWKNYKDFRRDMYNSYIRHLKKYGRENTTIDRIDNDGNYCKKNCKWATQQEQKNNTSRSVFLTFRNQTKTMGEWAKELSIHKSTLAYRIKRGWSIEKTLSTPVL